MENTILDIEEFAGENDYRDYLAPKWKRLVNYIFDALGMIILFAMLYAVFFERNLQGWESVRVNLYSLLFMLGIYYFCELYTGRTLGKLITGTKVISTDNEPLSAIQVFYRTISRIVPFEPFSMFFGITAWHDDWSDTVVVDNSYMKKN